jgi:hypothetical protein
MAHAQTSRTLPNGSPHVCADSGLEGCNMNPEQLPGWLSDLVANAPKAGAGVHNWTFRVARHLLAHYPATKVIETIKAAAANCGRNVPDREIVAAVQNAVGCAWTPRGNGSISNTPALAKSWPNVNQEQREDITANGGGLADLWEASPLRLEDSDQHTEQVVDALFPGNPLLCCGKANSAFDTKPREEWRGELASLALVVPSAMSALTGTTKDGKESKHTLDNTGPRRFLVTEFDQGTADEHAALLLHLSRYAPLVLAVHSGNKSLHGWFYCVNQDEDKLRKFMRYAVSLGADRATWTRSQFVRMPDGTRDNGKRQTVYFFNPFLKNV